MARPRKMVRRLRISPPLYGTGIRVPAMRKARITRASIRRPRRT